MGPNGPEAAELQACGLVTWVGLPIVGVRAEVRVAVHPQVRVQGAQEVAHQILVHRVSVELGQAAASFWTSKISSAARLPNATSKSGCTEGSA